MLKPPQGNIRAPLSVSSEKCATSNLHCEQQWSINRIRGGIQNVQLCLVQYEALQSTLRLLPTQATAVV
jgi:hypothetical protein